MSELKLKILYCILLSCFLTCPPAMAALWEKQGDLDKIVMVEDGALKGTGFLTVFREKLVVISNQEAVGSASEIKLRDVNGKEIKYVKLFIPEDKRDLVIFELDEEEGKRPFFTMVENAAQSSDLDAAVTIYAFRAGTKTLSKARGKITGIGPEMFEINVKMPDIIGGGPVVLRDSGKVIASCASGIKDAKDSKTRIFGTRMDTAGKLVEINISCVKEETARFKSFFDNLKEYDSRAEELKNSYSAFKLKSSKNEKVSPEEISAFRNLINEQITLLNNSIEKWKNAKSYELPFFETRHETELKNTNQLLNNLKELNRDSEIFISKE